MAPLPNTKHELFCLAISRGASASAAYIEAGYRGNTANAARLRATAAIKQRIAELAEAAGRANEISIAGVLAELDAAIKLAKDRGMPNALINAANLRAKLGGLLIEKAEVTVNNSNNYADCASFPEVARTLASDQLSDLVNARWLPIDESDHEYLAGLWLDHFTQVRKFLDSVEARPLLKSGMTLLTERDIKPTKA
jgi:hypothetical protein